MSKVFIFTASTGAGHNLAAQSLKESLDEAGYQTEVYDAFKETNITLDRLITKGYQQIVVNVPKLYEQMYNQFNNMNRFQQGIFQALTKVMNPDIVPLINSGKPDLIITTHPFVTNVLGTLKEHHAFDVPVLSIVTDYKIHTLYLKKMIDAYVVGSDYTKQTMVDKGVAEEIIYPYGIPIRQTFLKNNHLERKETANVAGTILLMAGSLGSKQMEKAFSSLLKVKEKIRIIVVCGNNEKIEKDIKNLYAQETDDQKIVEIHGFVNNVSELMDESDAIISKPGGLTTTEAIVKNIPMIIPFYYPGQEEENADYLVDGGMAIKVDKIKDLTSMVDFLFENKYIIKRMSENMSEEAQKRSMSKTIELCRNLIADYTTRKSLTEPQQDSYKIKEIEDH
ncbi:MAG: processive 1,2-diacylglycerol beta-glucosyltransferase [Acetobacterium sp.]|jgi:processive 1,2-diacylglycerol beta-glucosyltransferase|uniref:MGDG synthase family glycosyltransferase n=1 Tax=unclassified Acetobacterium TaxID=2638182 RepID=UPI000DBEB7C4|nr:MULTISPECIES: glycosyltransferase [unclassified Acetobacterium]AWW25663.1 galactosyldiacylglycerol synthase [Acetobacterium sp. KB-1]MDK2942380.1 processive 1,2-diacylglycerol beta-glucosyltransferase [Acetobacterium sp.]MDZ5724618.1 glycosyltransferase [Acetobacterium sp. K1/6]